MELRLELKLTQKLVMTPQLQQAIKLLQLSRLELQQTLSQHLMENPLLEEGESEVEEEEGTDSPAEGKETVSADGESSGEVEQTEFSESLSSEEWEDRKSVV